jgi:hypothetical protein
MVFSLSSDEGGGEGREEELGFIGFPLSPLVPREARESQRKVHSNLNSAAVGHCRRWFYTIECFFSVKWS